MAIAPNVDKSPYFDATIADGVASFAVYNHMYMPTTFGDPDGEYNRKPLTLCFTDILVYCSLSENNLEINQFNRFQ